MSDTHALPALESPGRQKAASLLWCAGVGFASLFAGRPIRWLIDSVFPSALVPPAGVPDVWWTIDTRATSLAIRELLILALFAVFLRLRGMRLVDLGFKKPGTKGAWAFAFVLLALGLVSHPFVRSGPYPLAAYTLYAGAMIGIPVALLEESIYRGFAIATLRAGGFGIRTQILFSGLVFGAVHIFYVGNDWTVPVFTGLLGCLWSWIYIMGRDSLWPTLVVHAINDAVIMPYFYLHKVY